MVLAPDMYQESVPAAWTVDHAEADWEVVAAAGLEVVADLAAEAVEAAVAVVDCGGYLAVADWAVAAEREAPGVVLMPFVAETFITAACQHRTIQCRLRHQVSSETINTLIPQ